MNKYKVKEGRRIVHAGVEYTGGAEVEFTPELALHHAVNIELVKETKAQSKVEVHSAIEANKNAGKP